MRIAILSRNKNLHSIRRLRYEAKKSRVHCDIIDPLECELLLGGKEKRSFGIIVGSTPLPKFDAVLPRIGASITDYGLAVVKQFEALGVHPINGSQAIAESRDKMRSLQILSKYGLLIPTTVLTRTSRGLRHATSTFGEMPVVLKVLKGTQGVGVMLVHSPVSLGSVHETLRALDQDVLVQQFIAEGAGRDFRAFVIGNKVAAAMMRIAPEGEFRSNIHRGGSGKLVQLSPAYEKAAIKASRIFGLEVAGVDLMSSHRGPVVLEVNSSPGFEGIERATGLNIARSIILHIKNIVQRKKKKQRRR